VDEGRDTASSSGSRRWLVALGVAAALVVLAIVRFQSWRGIDRFEVRGIDVSHHQGEIDWNRVATADLRFAFIKATEGRDHQDTRFGENWAAAREAGLTRGAYHFFTFCSPGDAQAAHFLEVVPPTPGALPPVVDVEFAGNCKAWSSVAEIRAELDVFLDRVEAAWGVQPILYITSESEGRIIGGHFEGHPVWIRNTLWRPSSSQPPWIFWQFTDEGEVPGISTPVDMNVYRGSPEELAALTR
jgi:lysozyme